MQSITNKSTKDTIILRIELLSESDNRIWGQMSVHQNVCHMTDQLRLAMEQKESIFIGNIILTTIVKKMIMLGLRAPKGKVQTVNELKQGVGGTRPGIFENDKQTLIKLIDNFYFQYLPGKRVMHPAFGKLSRDEWGKLAYSHLNHHLEQFGR